MAGLGSNSKRGRGRLEPWPNPHTYTPPTTSNVSTSTTPTTSTPPGRPPHGQEFVMIPNLGYVELGSQPSFPP